MNFKIVFLPPQCDATRRWAGTVRDEFPEAKVAVPETQQDARREIVDADAAFGRLPAEVLREAKKLRWLQAPAAAPPAGYYHPDLVRHPVTVTNFRGVYNDHCGHHILAFVLAFARGLHRYLPQQREHRWEPAALETGVVHLPEATALLIGVGGIGGEAARLCAAFGMRVIGVDSRRRDPCEGIVALYPPDALDTLLPKADFVIMTIPHTPATEGLIDAGRLARMKDSAFLINVGRGATVRLDDLDDALRDGRIAGAALDVCEVEPLPPEHPLWEAPNLLLTPHTAGYGPHLDARRTEIILDNCRRFAKNEPLRNVVDKERWF